MLFLCLRVAKRRVHLRSSEDFPHMVGDLHVEDAPIVIKGSHRSLRVYLMEVSAYLVRFNQLSTIGSLPPASSIDYLATSKPGSKDSDSPQKEAV